MSTATILVIEDDPEIRELLRFTLVNEGWTIREASDGEEGIRSYRNDRPDCVVLDLMLPRIGGLEVLREIRRSPGAESCPVILATARGEDSDVIAGLELGADDYMVKPFSPRVLAARIRVALRRVQAASASAQATGTDETGVLEESDLRLDPERRELSCGGQPVELTATEFDLLELLMRNPGRVFTRGKILESIKGSDYPVTDRAVDVQILALRKKLGLKSACIETVRGVGYRFATT